MRWIVALLALLGVLASAAALREHYRTDTSPCRINDKWDCGTVNHSPYAVFLHVPVADIGIVGYLLLGILALKRAWRTALLASVMGLGFSLYLTNIEATRLLVWCIYCVISLSIISFITLLNLVMAIRKSPGEAKN